MRADVAKLIVAILLDLADFTIGRMGILIPGFEMGFDAVLGVAAVALWGWPGLIAFWELADPTGQADGFVPTLTLIALSQMGKSRQKRARLE